MTLQLLFIAVDVDNFHRNISVNFIRRISHFGRGICYFGRGIDLKNSEEFAIFACRFPECLGKVDVRSICSNRNVFRLDLKCSSIRM